MARHTYTDRSIVAILNALLVGPEDNIKSKSGRCKRRFRVPGRHANVTPVKMVASHRQFGTWTTQECSAVKDLRFWGRTNEYSHETMIENAARFLCAAQRWFCRSRRQIFTNGDLKLCPTFWIASALVRTS